MREREHKPRCPRCGYDQSGEIARWTESCPLMGVCPECGQEFCWGVILSPERHAIRWLPEHARNWRGCVWRSFRVTPIVLLRPTRFWRAVGVEAQTSWRGIICYLVLGGLSARIVLSLLGAGREIWEYLDSKYAWYPNPPRDLGEAVVRAFEQALLPTFNWWDWGGPVESTWLLGLLLAHAVYAAMFLVLPHTRRRARLKAAHIWRAFAYGMGIVLVIQTLGAVCMTLDLIAYRFGLGAKLDDLRYELIGFHTSAWPGLIGALWIAWWWRCAIVRGWRVESGGLVWTLLTIVAGILGGACFATIDAFSWMWA